MFRLFKDYLLQDMVVFLYSDKLPCMPPYVHQPYHCSQILSYIKSLGLNMYSEEYKKGFTWRKSLPQPSALSRSKLGRERLSVPLRLLILQLWVQMGLAASIIRMVYYYPKSFLHLHDAPLG